MLSAVGSSAVPVTLPADLGSARRTHVFVLDDLVVKLDQQASGRVQREQAALELLGATDLPVPRFVASGDLVSGRPWLVMTRLAGVEPADASAPAHGLSTAMAADAAVIERKELDELLDLMATRRETLTTAPAEEHGGRLDGDFADRVAHHVLGWCLAIFAYLGTIIPESVSDARRARASVIRPSMFV